MTGTTDEAEGFLQACVRCKRCGEQFCVVAETPARVPCPHCGSAETLVEAEDPWTG